MIPEIRSSSITDTRKSADESQRSSSASQKIFQKTIAQKREGLDSSTTNASKSSLFSKHDPELLAQIDQEDTSLSTDSFQRKTSDEFLSSNDSSPITTDESSSFSRHDPELLLQIFRENCALSTSSSRSTSPETLEATSDSPDVIQSTPEDPSPSPDPKIEGSTTPAKIAIPKLSREQIRPIYERHFMQYSHQELATTIVKDEKALFTPFLKNKKTKLRLTSSQQTSIASNVPIDSRSEFAQDVVSQFGGLHKQMKYHRNPEEIWKQVRTNPNATKYILGTLTKAQIVDRIPFMKSEDQVSILLASSTEDQLRELLTEDATNTVQNNMKPNQQYEFFKTHLPPEEFAQLYPDV